MKFISCFRDLLARNDLEQAYQLTAKHVESLDDGYLRFQYLCLAVRLGQIESASDWLENSLNTEHWISVWLLRRSDYSSDPLTLPRFEKCLQDLEKKRKGSIGQKKE